MKQLVSISFAIGATLMLAGCLLRGGNAPFKLTLCVVDDEGSIVSGAKVRMGAEGPPKGADTPGKGIFVEGTTDERGLFSGEVVAWDATHASYNVTKTGYYDVWVDYSASSISNGKWQPWNPTIDVVLKRIKHPVPMYSKRFAAEIPVRGGDVGFDLTVGDWVTPYGKGRISDLIFHGEGDVINDRDFRGVLTVTFSGPGDGLIPFESQRDLSSLRMPYEAPKTGYEPKRVWHSARKFDPEQRRNVEFVDEHSASQNFFLRVRSKVDADGNVVSGLYGKIFAPFGFDPRGLDRNGKTGRQYVSFTYALNPDGSRNIEGDPKRNLLKSTRPYDLDYEMAP